MKVTLTHIGAVSLGRLLAIWSFVLGVVLLVLAALLLLILAIVGIMSSDNPTDILGGGAIGFIMFLVVGVVALIVNSVFAFILGVLAATVYNIVLKVGGGIDLDLDERTA